MAHDLNKLIYKNKKYLRLLEDYSIKRSRSTKERVTYTIDREVVKKLYLYAKAHNKSMSNIVEELLIEKIK